MSASTLPEEQGVFTSARPHLRTMVKNLSLSLLAGNMGQMPAHAKGARITAKEAAMLAGYARGTTTRSCSD